MFHMRVGEQIRRKMTKLGPYKAKGFTTVLLLVPRSGLSRVHHIDAAKIAGAGAR